MHDNAPSHSAASTKDNLARLKWKTLNWPPFSPDLNPIENLWAIIKNRIYGRHTFDTVDLMDQVDREWKSFDRTATLINLVKSMPRRIREVIRNKGYPINY